MRGYELARYTDRTADAAVSVIVDRVIGLLAYMSTAAVAAFILVTFRGRSDLQAVEWVAGMALVVLVAGFSVLLSRRLRGFISRCAQSAAVPSIGRHLGETLRSIQLLSLPDRALAVAFGIVLLGIGCTTLVNWCLSQAVGGQMSLPIIMLINPLIALVLMLPISIGGLGLNQAAYPFFYGLARVTATTQWPFGADASDDPHRQPAGGLFAREAARGRARRGSMSQPIGAPYGSWRSPITPDLIVAGWVRVGDPP